MLLAKTKFLENYSHTQPFTFFSPQTWVAKGHKQKFPDVNTNESVLWPGTFQLSLYLSILVP